MFKFNHLHAPVDCVYTGLIFYTLAIICLYSQVNDDFECPTGMAPLLTTHSPDDITGHWYLNMSKPPFLIIDCEAGEIIRLVASVCLSVCLSFRALIFWAILHCTGAERVVIGTRLRQVQHRGRMKHKSIHNYHYQSKVFVCVSVFSCCFDRLLFREVAPSRSITLLRM